MFMEFHNIDPVYSKHSQILILGSFPSKKSRESGFYYGHPQNRFWKMMARIYVQDLPVSISAKKKLIIDHDLALWDVIASCEISGSADSSIHDVRANDVKDIIEKSQISRIILNGRTAEKLYREYLEAACGISGICLPSTSPANAAYSLDRLCDIWAEYLLYTNKEK